MPDTLFRTFDTMFDKTVVLSYTLVNLDAAVHLLPGKGFDAGPAAAVG